MSDFWSNAHNTFLNTLIYNTNFNAYVWIVYCVPIRLYPFDAPKPFARQTTWHLSVLVGETFFPEFVFVCNSRLLDMPEEGVSVKILAKWQRVESSWWRSHICNFKITIGYKSSSYLACNLYVITFLKLFHYANWNLLNMLCILLKCSWLLTTHIFTPTHLNKI